jgi:elongation factor Ts
MSITAQMVKDLRDKTGAGMMDCKKALTENNGDMEAAVTFLREKGLAAAAKKAGRVAAEGLVGIFVQGNVAALAEVNCETDFVAKNDDFQRLVTDVTEHVALKNPGKVKAEDEGTGEALYAQAFAKNAEKTVSDIVTEKVATIGENIGVRRFVRLEGGSVYGSYSHGGGNIGVLVELTLGDAGKADDEKVQGLARDLAMHVASEAPLALRREELDADIVEQERQIFRQQAVDSGKPENILDKIVEGRVQKFYGESCLLEQGFIKDPDVKVAKLVEQLGKELGTSIEVSRYARFKVGEGIEKKSDNLAEEVAKMTGG